MRISRRRPLTATLLPSPFLLVIVLITATLSAILLLCPHQPASAAVPPSALLLKNETKKLQSKQFKAVLKAFHTWFESHYGEKLDVRVTPIEGMRLGVEALRKFRKDEPYLKVPLKVIVDANTLTGPNGPPIFKDFWPWLKAQQRGIPTQPVQLLLASFLVYARWVAPSQNETTFWDPYVDLLPRQVDTPEHAWTDGDLEALDGFPKMREKIKSNRAHHKTELRWLLAHVATHPKFSRVLPKWVLGNMGRWSWAMGILGTRMIWWEGGPHLVPLLDMVNCDAGPEKIDGPRHVHETVREGDRAVTRAGWIIQKGDEVTENYGQHNAYYLLNHGFFLDFNPHDCYYINLPPVTRELSRRAMFIARAQTDNDEICFSMTNAKRLAPAIDVARIHTLPDKVLEKAIATRELPLKDTDKQTRRALRFLGKALRQKQTELYKTQKKFSHREPEIEDAPHAQLVSDYAESLGLPMSDAVTELKKRIATLTERINVREARRARELIEAKKREAEESAKVVGGEGEDEVTMPPENAKQKKQQQQEEDAAKTIEKKKRKSSSSGGSNLYGSLDPSKSSKRTTARKRRPAPKIDDDF